MPHGEMALSLKAIMCSQGGNARKDEESFRDDGFFITGEWLELTSMAMSSLSGGIEI